MDNKVRLSGRIIKEYARKFTPAGLLVITFLLEHNSSQVEAGEPLSVKCRIYCILLGATLASTLETRLVNVLGFLSQNSKLQLVLHVNQINFLDEGK